VPERKKPDTLCNVSGQRITNLVINGKSTNPGMDLDNNSNSSCYLF